MTIPPSYTHKNEKHIEYGDRLPEAPTLHRAMSSRQVQMIAVAGTIGTGLFLGTGTALAKGGPASILLAYSLAGFLVYCTMCALGEMATYLPTTGSFTDYACRFVSKSYGFSLSWVYWFQNAITLAADLTAAQVLLGFWTKDSYPEFPTVVISIVFLVLLMGLNGIHVKGYAEGEYWLSILKVLTIIVFIITGVVVSAGANTTGESIGFQYWTIGEAPFANGIGGFAQVFVTAAFAYAGTESISITAGETKNPRRNMPRIIENVFYRILLFYIVAIFVITINVPYNMKGLAGSKEVTMSPFTMVFKKAGIDAAAHVVNAVILSSCLSAGNHALFSGTRILFSLAKRGQAPEFLGRVNKNGVPVYSVLATALISVVCLSLYVIGSRTIFECLLVMVGVSTQISWISISYTSLRFREALIAQNRSIEDLPFVNKFYPYGNYISIGSVSLLIVGQCSNLVMDTLNNNGHVLDVIAFFLVFILFACLFVGYKYLVKPIPLTCEKMDLDSGRYFDTEEDMAENEKEETEKFGPKYYFQKIFFFMF